jgi:hypothetical protein
MPTYGETPMDVPTASCASRGVTTAATRGRHARRAKYLARPLMHRNQGIGDSAPTLHALECEYVSGDASLT